MIKLKHSFQTKAQMPTAAKPKNKYEEVIDAMMRDEVLKKKPELKDILGFKNNLEKRQAILSATCTFRVAPAASFRLSLKPDIDRMTGQDESGFDDDMPKIGGAWSDTRD